MAAVGEVGIYKAPTDILAGDSQILARVGPGTESAALVTGVSDAGATVNLRVFPDQQSEFSIRGLNETEDPVKGSFITALGTQPASRKVEVAKVAAPNSRPPVPVMPKPPGR